MGGVSAIGAYVTRTGWEKTAAATWELETAWPKTSNCVTAEGLASAERASVTTRATLAPPVRYAPCVQASVRKKQNVWSAWHLGLD